MIPEIWTSQCAWCGSAIAVHRDCLDIALAAREERDGPILVCSFCAEGNTVKGEKIVGVQCLWLVRTNAETMATMKAALNSSGAAAYIKRRLN